MLGSLIMIDVFCAAERVTFSDLLAADSRFRRGPSDRDPSRPHLNRQWRFLGRCAVVFVTLLLGQSLLLPAHADEGLDDYNLAISLFNQQRWKPAAEQFRTFLAAHEKHEKAALGRLYLGLTLGKLDDYKASREELLKFAEANRQSPYISQARYRIGECSYLLDDLPNARIELEGFVQAFPKDSMCEYALPYLGDTVLRLKDPGAALKIFDRAIEQFPTGKLIDDAKFGRARSLETLKRFDDAIAQYRELTTQKNGVRAADAQLHLGASYFERKQFAEAILAYNEFTKDFPQSPLVPTAQLNAGYAYFQTGKFAEAARQFELVSKDKSQGMTAAYWQGRSLKSLGDYAKAAEVLKVAAAGSQKHALAEAIIFEQALCERYLQHPVEARTYFEQVLKQFPMGDLADDSLHALIEMSIEAGDLSEAEELLARFQKAYPQSGLRLHIEMLSGRLDLARAGVMRREKQPAAELTALYDDAARRFEQIMTSSSIPRTQRQARYYLALTRQLQDKPSVALEVIAPLVEQATADGAKSDFVDALVLQADCYYQQQKYPLAAISAAKYLELVPSGRQVARALLIRAMSADQLNDAAALNAALDRLKIEFGDHALTSLTLQQLADAAETRQDWVASGKYYEVLAQVQKDPERQAYAIRGLALSQYSQHLYEAAATTFGRVPAEFPKHSLVSECTYYRAECLKEAKQSDQALVLFKQLFESFPDDKPVAGGAETEPPLEFNYKAGWWIARILTNQNKVVEADAAYEALLKRFPKPNDLDKRLYEWARLNHDNDRFDQADVIWRRLVKEVPLSLMANNAKLHLAESDLMADKFDDARQTFEELATSDKSADDVKERSLFQLVSLAVGQQRWPDARVAGERLATQFPKSVYLHYVAYGRAEALLAPAKTSEQDLATARQLLQSLQAESSNDDVKNEEWFDRVWVLLAELNFREKKYDEVLTVVEDLKRRNPRSPYVYQAEEVLGRSFKQQAPPKFDEARAAFERVLANPFANRTETAAKSQYMIGETYLLQEKWSSAFVAYQKVYSLYRFPEWQAAGLFMSARCDEKQNEWKPAVEAYKRLIMDFPTFSQIDDVKLRLEAAQKRANE